MATTAKSKSKKQLQADERALQTEWTLWLEDFLAPKTLSEIAREAAVASNTLTRRLDPDYPGLLNPLTIRMICNHWRVPGPDGFKLWRGMREEIRSFDYQARSVDGAVRAIIATLLDGRPNASPKLVETTALEGVGLLQGDIIIVEQGLEPASGDVVVANIYDEDRGAATTVVRVYRKAGALGFLLPPPTDPTGEAHLVDGNLTRITSVVTQSFRPQARAAISRTAIDPKSENQAQPIRPKRSRS